ncbi:MAG: hypothetical protein M3R04_09050 [bacterium]|nr:hypothetical protein [bacterium]
MAIKFGSDGWRGIIGEDFTLDNVARITAAVCQWWPDERANCVTVGYDNRELSLEAAVHVCRVFELLKPDITVFFPYEPCPSPFISWATHYNNSPIGIQITASHNPPSYNGVKLKGSYGGSLVSKDVEAIERIANSISSLPAVLPETRYEQEDDIEYEYQMQLDYGGATLVGNSNSRPFAYDHTCGQKLIVDQMHGATNIYLRVLGEVHEITHRIRNFRDPTFGGSKPEPLEHLLPELIQRIKDANDGTIGLAFDGDGDRLAVIDETGAYLQSHEIFALLLDFLARSGYEGSKVVTSVSFASLPGRIAQSYGYEVIETPVGFKHVSEAMLAGGVLIGGEESGGAAFGHYLPERDALLMALTLLRAKGEAGVTLHEMLRDIYTRFGRSEFVHVDVQLDPTSAQEFRTRIPSLMEVSTLAGESVTTRSDQDGVKLRTANGWVLVRASGTEPLGRFYAEAGNKADAQRMIEDVRSKLL